MNNQWSVQQIELLQQLISLCKGETGFIKWQQVSRHFDNKAANDCRNYYFKNLIEQDSKEAINNHWSPDDLIQLVLACHYIGKNFKVIQQLFFPDLTPLKLKNKYYVYSVKRGDMKMKHFIKSKQLPKYFLNQEQLIQQKGELFCTKNRNLMNQYFKRQLPQRNYIVQNDLFDNLNQYQNDQQLIDKFSRILQENQLM